MNTNRNFGKKLIFGLMVLTALPYAASAAPGACDNTPTSACFESVVGASAKKLDNASTDYCTAQIKKEGNFESPSLEFASAVSECRSDIYKALAAADAGDLASLRAKGGNL